MTSVTGAGLALTNGPNFLAIEEPNSRVAVSAGCMRRTGVSLCPLCNLILPFLTVCARVAYTKKFEISRTSGCRVFAPRVKWTTARLRTTKGDCFAKAHLSTAPTSPRQNARLPRTHEVKRRPQGVGGTPQEGAPSAYPRLGPGTRRCPALRAKIV